MDDGVHAVYRFALICLLILLSACSTLAPRRAGVTSLTAQEVSIGELLGHPEAFDGKNVRVIGVAAIDLGFEGASELYVDQAAYRHVTFSRIGIGEFAAPMMADPKLLKNLSGHYVLIQGKFHMVSLDPDTSSICLGACWYGYRGYLDPIQGIEERLAW